MRYRLRQLDLDDKMCQQVKLEIIEQIYPRSLICEHLDQHHAWEERERKLNMVIIFSLLLAAALWTRLAYQHVLERLARPLHVLGLPLKETCVSRSGIWNRRQQLGSALLQGVLAQGCRPTPSCVVCKPTGCATR